MSQGRVGGRSNDANRDDGGPAALLSAADWIGLAAAPAFAVMAMVTAALGGGAPEGLCSIAHGAPMLGGMVAMYALMSAAHLPPWIRRIAQRDRRARQA